MAMSAEFRDKRARVKVDALKFASMKLLPRVYGEARSQPTAIEREKRFSL
jgi:hypothetical protein